MVRSASVSAQLVEVCAIASGGSGQEGVPRSTELSQLHCSTMCRNGSKQQYLMCALKSSVLKTVLVLNKWMCCSIMIAWSARPVRCLWWVDHAECQPDFCIADAMCCRVLRVLVFFAGYAWILELRRDAMRYTDHGHGLSVYVGIENTIFFHCRNTI